MIVECEVRHGNDWVTITIEEALERFQGEDKRCPRCHGRVFPHKKYSNGVAAHFEHKQAHEGCKLSKLHPDALT